MVWIKNPFSSFCFLLGKMRSNGIIMHGKETVRDFTEENIESDCESIYNIPLHSSLTLSNLSSGMFFSFMKTDFSSLPLPLASCGGGRKRGFPFRRVLPARTFFPDRCLPSLFPQCLRILVQIFGVTKPPQ